MSQSGFFNNIAASQAAFMPNQVIQDFVDFIGGPNKFTILGSNGPYIPISGTSTNPGLEQLNPGQTSAFLVITDPAGGTDSFAFGAGEISMNWVYDLVNLSTNANNYTIYIGLMLAAESSTSTVPTSGVYFQYNHNVNSGKWQIVTANASVYTVINTNIFAATGFHNFGITVNPTGTSVDYFINGINVSANPITTNIPSIPLSPSILVLTSAGTIPLQQVDLWYYTQNLTVAR
jgi:hypothetical protein